MMGSSPTRQDSDENTSADTSLDRIISARNESSCEAELESTVEFEAVGEVESHHRLVASFEHQLSHMKTTRRLNRVFAKALKPGAHAHKAAPAPALGDLSDFEAALLRQSQQKSRRVSRTPPPPLADERRAAAAAAHEAAQSADSSRRSSPVAVSFTASVASSTAGGEQALDDEGDFPLHTVVLSKDSPLREFKSYSPVSSIDTVREQPQPRRDSIELRRSIMEPLPGYGDQDYDFDPSESLLELRELPSSSTAVPDDSIPLPLSSNILEPLPLEPDQSQKIQTLEEDLILYKTALQSTRLECDELKDRVSTMQRSFDDAVRKEMEVLEQELDQEYTLKLEEFKNSFIAEFMEKEGISDEKGLRNSETYRSQGGTSMSVVDELKSIHASEIESLQQKIDALIEERKQLEDSLSHCQAELEEASSQQEAQNAQIKQILGILEQANEERGTMHELLIQEKAKTSRSEEEFRLFGKKLRGLQDLNSELRNENDELRTELRKLQYEGNASSEKDDYYKAKLDQARFDNESLRAVIATLTNQQTQDSFRHSSGHEKASPTDPASRISPRHRQSMPNFRNNTSNNIFPTSSSTSSSIPVRSVETTPIKQHQRLNNQYQHQQKEVPHQHQQAWTPQSQHLQNSSGIHGQRSVSASSARGTPTTADREKFLNKMRRYEEEEEEEDDGTEYSDVGSLGAGADSRSINSTFFRRSGGASDGNGSVRRSSFGGGDGGLVSSGGSGAFSGSGSARRVASMGVFSSTDSGLPVRETSSSRSGPIDYVAMKAELDGQLRTLTDKKAAVMSELQ
ncbi:hypothetical protein BDR26DRAFT_1012132, partial [Obelidium mucronatum]